MKLEIQSTLIPGTIMERKKNFIVNTLELIERTVIEELVKGNTKDDSFY